MSNFPHFSREWEVSYNTETNLLIKGISLRTSQKYQELSQAVKTTHSHCSDPQITTHHPLKWHNQLHLLLDAITQGFTPPS